MITLRQLDGEQLDAFALRLLDKTKRLIFEGRDHRRVHAIALKVTVAMVHYNFDHRRHGAGGAR